MHSGNTLNPIKGSVWTVIIMKETKDKFLATLKLIFDILPFIVIIGGSIGILFGWRP